jgi:hypothetical protein
MENLQQLANSLPTDTKADVTKSAMIVNTAGIFIGDIEAAQKCLLAINNRHLTVITLIEPVHAALEGGFVKGEQLNTTAGKFCKIGRWGIEATDVVVYQLDFYATLNSISKLCSQCFTDMIGMDDIIFQQDSVARGADSIQQGLKIAATFRKQHNSVMPVRNRQFRRTKTP